MLEKITYKDIMQKCNVCETTAKRIRKDIQDSLPKSVPFVTLAHLQAYFAVDLVKKV